MLIHIYHFGQWSIIYIILLFIIIFYIRLQFSFFKRDLNVFD